MDLRRITNEVERQMLRSTRGKIRRGDLLWTPSTVSGALSADVLCPLCTPERVEQVCREARRRSAAAVTLLPAFVSRGRELLSGSATVLTAAVGYPWGSLTPNARTALARDCLAAGADELEVALDQAAVKSGGLAREQEALGELVRLARSGGRTLSVLVDLRLLTESEQVEVLSALRRCGADLVTLRKCADPADVRLARELLGNQAAVKAATHQPEDYHLARALLEAGALRVGVSQLAE